MTKPYSQLKAMLAISKASFRSITRSPSAVVFTLAFPMIFIVVFGFLSGGGFRMDVGLSKESDKFNPVYLQLKNIPVLNLIENKDDAALLMELEKGRIDAIINIKPNLDKSTGSLFIIDMQTTAATRDGGSTLKMFMDNIINKMNLTQANLKTTVAEIKETEIPGRQYKTIDFILPGQLGFSLLSTGVFGTAFVFFSLRQTLVIKRFFATPIQRPYIVLGEALSRLVFALLGASFIITIGYLAFGFTLVHGLVTALTMLLLAAIGLIVFMGFGFIISGIAKSESTIPPMANIITLPQFLLSGTFFGIDNFPSWLQPVCKILPLTYLNDAMRKVAFEGAGLTDIGSQLLILFIWGIGIYLLAFRVFKWE
jgi:ABC-2 type transport system permease protein